MPSSLQLREGETVGDYVMRLEKRVKELEPPEGFTDQEWHISQVYVYMLWMDDTERADQDAFDGWRARLKMFQARFPEAVQKFSDYMGWKRKEAS